ncbi:MAG: PRC-barrel domain-containing protein [Anaerolineales bacterium]|jgi:sporulation protein YlmC with PRC-barrel domain
MDIPINVEVLCAGETCGRSTYLVINPINERITHLVVTEKAFPNIERLVPIDKILASSPNSIQLRCKLTDLSNMDTFEETDFIESGQLEASFPYEVPYEVWPYAMYDVMPMPFEHEHIPAGEVIIRRGTSVKATDGDVGKVDEFLVDPENDVITHLVLREGHLWGKKDVTIPVSEIKKIAEEAVYLKLDKKAIESLPTIPVNRKWK